MDTSARPAGAAREHTGADPDPRRWAVLGVLGLLQFMVILDITIVNVALPTISAELGFTAAGLAWVVNGYVLAAGGLLLLGGRLGDVLGRRRMLLVGAAVFGVASLVAAAATGPGWLVAARFAQGLGEALVAPASLGLIAVLFSDRHERMQALGVWGGLAGIAGAVGPVLSGVLTELASWRLIFLINVPVVLFVLVAAARLVRPVPRVARRIDAVGAVTATAGLVSVVYALLQAGEQRWVSTAVVVPLVAGLALLLVTAVVERRVPDPLLPRGFFSNRTRVVANAVTLPFTATLFAYAYLLTLFQQQVLGWTPLQTGLSYLPFGVAMGVGVGLGTALVGRLGVRGVAAAGYVGAAVAIAATATLAPDTTYVTGILPWMVLFGICGGATVPAVMSAALDGVTDADSGIASGVQGTAQQIGGALGLAGLVAIAVAATGSGTAGSGTAAAFVVAAVLLVVGAATALLLPGPSPREENR